MERLAAVTEQRGVPVRRVGRLQVHEAFAERDACNKDDRAALIGALFPQLAAEVPPHRELWMSETEKMAIFDAMALLLSSYGIPAEPVGDALDRYHAILR